MTLVDLLVEARLRRQPLEDEAVLHLVPTSIDEAYRTAEKVCAKLGLVLGGWKVGATSAPAQAALDLDRPFFGRIARQSITTSPGRVDAETRPVVLDAEIAIVLCPAAAGSIEELAFGFGLREVRLAIEINRSSSVNAIALGAGFVIADNGANDGAILGPVVDLDSARLDSIGVDIRVDGRSIARGIGADVLGHPLNSVRWFLEEAAKRNLPLEEGQVILTGAMTPPFDSPPGSLVVADFGVFGSVEVKIEKAVHCEPAITGRSVS
jgi:2-keto-4-pentenoate hydratase